MKIRLFRILLPVMVLCALLHFLAPAVAEESEEYTSGDYTYVLLEDGSAMITRYDDVNKRYTLNKGTDTLQPYSEDANGERAILHLPEVLDGHPVAAIGDFAFTDMKIIRANLIIPNSITDISPRAFEMYPVHAFIISENHPKYTMIDNMLYDKVDMRLVYMIPDPFAAKLTVPEGTRIIGEYALQHSSFEEIILPESLRSIEYFAFSLNEYLKSIVIPDKVTFIDDFAFYNCTRLQKADLPKHLKTLGRGAFCGCISLTDISLPKGITEIKPETFSGCISLQNISLPKKLASIGTFAFRGCFSLKSIDLPEGLEYIYEGAFNSCRSLTEFRIPDTLKSIDKVDHVNLYAFARLPFPYGLENLERIIVSENHPYFVLADGALISRKDFSLIVYPAKANAETFIVPDYVSSVGALAFCNNQNLKSIVIAGSVESVGDCAFVDCPSLENVEFADVTSHFGTNLFYDCKNLKAISFPSGISRFIRQSDIEKDKTDRFFSDIINQWENIETIRFVSDAASEDTSELTVLLNAAKTAWENKRLFEDADSFIYPEVLTEEKHTALKANMSVKDKKKFDSYYRKIVLSKLTFEQQASYRAYITFDAPTFYIVKAENLKATQKSDLARILASYGYTAADYLEDLSLISSAYIRYCNPGPIAEEYAYDESGRIIGVTLCVQGEELFPYALPFPDSSR